MIETLALPSHSWTLPKSGAAIQRVGGRGGPQGVRPVRVFAVAGGLEVLVDALQGQRVGRHVPDLAPLAQHAQVGTPWRLWRPEHPQPAPKAVVQKGRLYPPPGFLSSAR